jgi:hypothetical protein
MDAYDVLEVLVEEVVVPLRKPLPLEYGTLLNPLDGIFVAFNSVLVDG